MRILRAVDRAREYLPLRAVLRFLRVSPSRFHAWRRRQSACALDDQSSCPRTSPSRLTPPEVRAIEDMVTSPDYRHVPGRSLCFAKIASGQKSLTFARLMAILQAMRDAIRMVAALRSALYARRDLLLEALALRHQLGVLAPSDRRFRPCDRLLWLCLRRLWPRWRAALVLVQPATVARWHREGFRGCWSRH